MRTHPEESLLESFLGIVACSLSLLRRESILLLLIKLSRLVLAVDGFDVVDDELPATLVMDPLILGRPVMLPIRSLGTRVWIFCSKLRTRARISETI